MLIEMAAENHKNEDVAVIDPDESGYPGSHTVDLTVHPHVHSYTNSMDSSPTTFQENGHKESTMNIQESGIPQGTHENGSQEPQKISFAFPDDAPIDSYEKVTRKEVVTKGLVIMFVYSLIAIINILTCRIVLYYWIREFSYYYFPIVMCSGSGILLIGLCVIAYMQYKLPPHSAALVVFGGLFSVVGSFASAFMVLLLDYETEFFMYFAVSVVTVLSIALLVYTSIPKVKFTTLRANMLCTFLLDGIFAFAYLSTYRYQRNNIVLADLAAVAFALYLVHDSHDNIHGTPKYSLLKLFANQCPTISTKDREGLDQTSLNRHQEETGVNGSSHNSFWQTNLQIQDGWKTWLVGGQDDEKCKTETNKAVTVDNLSEDLPDGTKQKEIIIRVYTVLVYQLFLAKYVFGFFYCHLSTWRWIRENIDLTRSQLQFLLLTNIPVVIVLIMNYFYKKRNELPRLWLLAVGTFSFITTVYLGFICTALTIEWEVEVLIVMMMFVCLAVMRYLDRANGKFNCRVAFFVAFYTLQATIGLMYVILMRTELRAALMAAPLALVLSIYLVYDMRATFRGNQNHSLIKLMDGLNKYRLAPSEKHDTFLKEIRNLK